ncbi:hypothetical protein [Sphingomonas sp.]|jgi:hypothetical protein|uniref:hypothetical protein n=1 Tax=Sphingomonas sp. TaxID=28214 RepID=UPI002ED9326D
MLHAPILARSVPSSTLHDDRPPITPARYVGLRRAASGKSIEQIAALIATTASNQAEVRALIRLLETPGTVARSLDSIALLQAAFSIDPAVYHQLATEHADRHPQICRGCGCSQNDACVCVELGNCAWAGPGICTGCTNGERF